METMNGDQRCVRHSIDFLVYDEVARVWRERSSMARAFWWHSHLAFPEITHSGIPSERLLQ